jgi:Fe2+ transport system protein B
MSDSTTVSQELPESVTKALPNKTQTDQTNETDQQKNQQSDQSSQSDPATIGLALEDIRRVIEQQHQQSQLLTTKLNILFAVNSGGLLIALAISKLILIPSIFSVAEMVGFMITFALLLSAFLPRQVAVTPNLGNVEVVERYLNLSKTNYQLQMIVNLVETYNVNKQRLDDKSKSLTYAAYSTFGIVVIIMFHVFSLYYSSNFDIPEF